MISSRNLNAEFRLDRLKNDADTLLTSPTLAIRFNASGRIISDFAEPNWEDACSADESRDNSPLSSRIINKKSADHSASVAAQAMTDDATPKQPSFRRTQSLCYTTDAFLNSLSPNATNTIQATAGEGEGHVLPCIETGSDALKRICPSVVCVNLWCAT